MWVELTRARGYIQHKQRVQRGCVFGLHAGNAGRAPAQPRAGPCLSAAAQASEARRVSACRGAPRFAEVPPARQSLVRVHEQLDRAA